MASSYTLIAVGRIGSGPEAQLCDAYAKRLRSSCTIIEIDDRKAPAHGRKAWEAERIWAACPKDGVLIALDEHGRHFSSREFASWLGERSDNGETLTFIIGGPDGLDDSILEKARLKLAFGAMTWPHKLVRTMVLEQLYRAGTILTGHPYHRD